MVETRRDKLVLITIVILFLATFGVLASDMYVPSLPEIADHLHVSANFVQSSITIYLIGVSLSLLVYGPISDRIGRRKTILIGMFIMFLGSIICWMAHSGPMLLFGRFVQSIGAGATSGLFRAVIRDVFSGEELVRVAALISSIFTLIPAVAPMIGGYLEHYWGWRASFAAITLYLALGLVIVGFFFKETNEHLNPHATRLSNIVKNYKTLLMHKHFVAYTFCSFSVMAGLFAYMNVSPFILQQLIGLTPVQYGWTAILITLASLLGKLVNIRLSQYMKGDRLIMIGLGLMAITGTTMLSYAYAHIINFYVVVIPTMIYLFAGGLVFVHAMSGAFTPFPHMTGIAASMYGALQILGGFVGGAVISLFQVHSLIPLGYVFTAIGLLPLSSFYWVIKREHYARKDHTVISGTNA